MKRLVYHSILLFLLAILPQNLPSAPSQSVKRLLHTKTQLGAWRASGEPQTVAGEDLYMLINGGAEIVLEYGFDAAVLHSYENDSGKSLNLEIYVMSSPEGAYGMYTFRKGRKGKEVAVGNEGFLEGYYLNFWKGNCLVTVIGFDTDDQTRQGVMKIGSAVAERIQDAGEKPATVDLLVKDGLDPLSIKYIRGNLGLYNLYEFDTANVFGLSEGILGQYDELRALLIAYGDENAAAKWFTEGTDRLSRNDRFTSFRRSTAGVSFKDNRGHHVMLESFQRWVLCGIGPDRKQITEHLDKQKARIQTMQEIPE